MVSTYPEGQKNIRNEIREAWDHQRTLATVPDADEGVPGNGEGAGEYRYPRLTYETIANLQWLGAMIREPMRAVLACSIC